MNATGNLKAKLTRAAPDFSITVKAGNAVVVPSFWGHEVKAGAPSQTGDGLGLATGNTIAANFFYQWLGFGNPDVQECLLAYPLPFPKQWFSRKEIPESPRTLARTSGGNFVQRSVLLPWSWPIAGAFLREFLYFGDSDLANSSGSKNNRRIKTLVKDRWGTVEQASIALSPDFANTQNDEPGSPTRPTETKLSNEIVKARKAARDLVKKLTDSWMSMTSSQNSDESAENVYGTYTLLKLMYFDELVVRAIGAADALKFVEEEILSHVEK